MLLHGQVWVKNDSKVPGRIRKGDVVRAKSDQAREGNGGRFQGRRKGKEKSFCFDIIKFELIFNHPCFYVVCAYIRFFGEVGHFTERCGFLELRIIHKKLMVYRVLSYVGERCSVQDKEENLVVNNVESYQKIQQKKNRNVLKWREYHLQQVTKQSRCCVLFDRLTKMGLFSWRWERSLWWTTFSRILDRN